MSKSSGNSLCNVSVLILTYNETIHLRRCIASVLPIAQDVFVVDSFSTDGTMQLAETLGAIVVQHKWSGLYALQFNWALDNLPIRSEWVLRLDADEYLTPELVNEIKERIGGVPTTVTGIVFSLRRVFLDRVIHYGMPEVKLLRLFRYGQARCEERMMDEHIEVINGSVIEFTNEFADHNLNNLSWWSQKHIGYAVREAADILDVEYNLFPKLRHVGQLGIRGEAKRRKKLRYVRLPLFWRTFFYFCLRYFVKGGWRDGVEGFLWHFLQGFWYRLFVDAKIWEIKRKSGGKREKIIAILNEEYGIRF